MLEINKIYSTAQFLNIIQLNKDTFRKNKELYLELLSNYFDYDYFIPKGKKNYYFKIKEILCELPEKLSLKDYQTKTIEKKYLEELKKVLKENNGYISASYLGRYIFYDCGNPCNYKNERQSIYRANRILKKYTITNPKDFIYMGTYHDFRDVHDRIYYRALTKEETIEYKTLVYENITRAATEEEIEDIDWAAIKQEFQIKTTSAHNESGLWVVSWKRHYLLQDVKYFDSKILVLKENTNPYNQDKCVWEDSISISL